MGVVSDFLRRVSRKERKEGNDLIIVSSNKINKLIYVQ